MKDNQLFIMKTLADHNMDKTFGLASVYGFESYKKIEASKNFYSDGKPPTHVDVLIARNTVYKNAVNFLADIAIRGEKDD